MSIKIYEEMLNQHLLIVLPRNLRITLYYVPSATGRGCVRVRVLTHAAIRWYVQDGLPFNEHARAARVQSTAPMVHRDTIDVKL